MPKNKVQFQKGLSLHNFLDEFGTAELFNGLSSAARGCAAVCTPRAVVQRVQLTLCC